MGEGHPRITIPRWIQLVGLPILLLVALMLVRPLGHVIFLFLTAGVIAFTLNPLVRDLTKIPRVPRGLAVGIVYLLFVALVIGVLAGIGTVAVDQARTAGDRIDAYITDVHPPSGKTELELDADRLQRWLDGKGLHDVNIEQSVTDWIDSLGAGEISRYVRDAITVARGAALRAVLFLFALILIVVISVYMLLDMKRLEEVIDRRFPPHGGLPLTQRIERALWGYVRGQFVLSTVIGASAGVGMWVLGATGAVEGAQKYALLFGLWAAFIEVVPYIGPWLSTVPPAIYAAFVDPVGVLWVGLLFLFIYQIEGHVVVPNVMANALRLHPLLVIFGLLAGGELYGIPGILIALPVMAGARAIWEFFGERVRLEKWEGTDGRPVPVEVEVEEPDSSPG
jgi:predicted PurR-regulated permease PerM